MDVQIFDSNVDTTMNVFLIIANILNIVYNVPQMYRQSSIQAHYGRLVKDNRRLFDSVLDSNELLEISNLFKNDDMFAAELTTYLC